MRIVQTFWTAGKDPLKDRFGWLHPEYNLMSYKTQPRFFKTVSEQEAANSGRLMNDEFERTNRRKNYTKSNE